LRSDGRLEHEAHVFDCEPDEVVALVRREPGAPPPVEVAARARRRDEWRTHAPPRVLGDHHAPPDAGLFPRGLRMSYVAMNAFLRTMETDESHHAAGHGVGVGSVTYRGRAVVAVDPEDAIARLEPGDVLVTTTTTPAFNSILPVAGALVTVHGGLMSHAGIASRELGIPAVLGVPDALDHIPDGAEIEVNPVLGTVRLVS
jgi:pyruvate,water dikinase